MLEKLIYDHYLEGDTERSHKVFKPEDKVYFNPSSFSACTREVYYKKRYTTPTNPITATSYLKMHFGTVLHTSIQSVIQRLGILIEAEKLRTKEFGGVQFRYKTDGIIVLNRQRTIMEIKTVSSGGLRIVRDEPKSSDIIQMVLYMLFESISNGVLLYVGRDSAFMEEYAVSEGDCQYTKALDIITKKTKELKVLEGNIKNGVMPKRNGFIEMKNKAGAISEDFQKDKTRHKSDWRCSYCQWKNLCWKEELEEINKHRFYIDGQFE